MGPFALLDLVGLDTSVSILDALHAESGDPNYAAVPTLRRMVAAGRLGRKSEQRLLRATERRSFAPQTPLAPPCLAAPGGAGPPGLRSARHVMLAAGGAEAVGISLPGGLAVSATSMTTSRDGPVADDDAC